jgi:hypothetical protein
MGSMASAIAEPIGEASEPIEPIESVEGGEESSESTEGTETETQESSVDPKTPLFQQARPALDKIKAENPQLAKQITQALIRDAKASQALPDGYQKAAQVMKDVESLAYPGSEGQPIEQVFTAVKSELAGWRDFDAKISAGDPSVLEELATASPEGFQNLVPAALERYAQINPEAYSTLVTKAVVADMHASEIPLQLRMMEAFIPRLADSPEKTEIIKAYNALVEWTNNLTAHSQRQIKAVKGQEKAPDGSQDQQQVQASREEGLTRELWNTKSNGFGISLIQKESTRLMPGISESDRNRVQAKVDEELAARFTVDQKFRENMNAFVKSKNYEGYKRMLHSKYSTIIPGAVSRAIADLGIKAGKPTLTSKTTPTVKTQVAEKQVAGEPNWEKITGHPRTQQGMAPIDLVRTTSEMLAKGRGYLKGGRAVRWR